MPGYLEFDPTVAALNAKAIEMAKADEPDFKGAREALGEGLQILYGHEQSVHTDVQSSRLVCDFGVVDVRHALHAAKRGKAHESRQYFAIGLRHIKSAYKITKPLVGGLLTEHGGKIIYPEGLLPAIQANHMATMTVMGRAVQARQAVEGEIRWGHRVSEQVIAEQHWFGRDGAYGLAPDSNNVYYTTSLCFNGARAERANGRPLHVLPWVLRGVKELRRVQEDPENRRPAIYTATRLSLESLTRFGALRAIKDYQRF